MTKLNIKFVKDSEFYNENIIYKKDAEEKKIKKRPIKLDRKFASPIITQLINKVMRDGGKRKAMKIVYQAIQIAEEKIALPPLTVLDGALVNTKPNLELRSWKIGGKLSDTNQSWRTASFIPSFTLASRKCSAKKIHPINFPTVGRGNY